MDSAKQAGKRAYEGVASAIAELPRLGREMRRNSGLEGIDVEIGWNPKEPGVMKCTVKITGDTGADRDKIKEKFPKSEGWTCTNTGDKTATCTNP